MPQAFSLRDLPGFGLDPTTPSPRPVQLVQTGEVVFGVENSAESEIDKCWLVMPSEVLNTGAGITDDAVDYNSAATAGYLPPKASVLISTESPYIGRLEG